MCSNEVIKVYVGTDPSQRLATEVLKHSIMRSTSSEVFFDSMESLSIPEPKDIKQSQRTRFSFARWAVPELCEHKGKAIYLDADMLVFQDIAHLWHTDLNDSAIGIVDGRDSSFCSSGVRLNKNETSVMVMDCEKFRWDIAELVNGLDGEYVYDDLMSGLCFLKESEIVRNVPRCWNAMDFWNEHTALLHYTNVPTQPWVYVGHPYGYVWVDYLKLLISEGAINYSFVEEEVSKGYIRPSLLEEIKGETCIEKNKDYIQLLTRIDKENNFIAHKEVMLWESKRKQAIYNYNKAMAKESGLFSHFKFILGDRINFVKKVIAFVKYRLKPLLG